MSPPRVFADTSPDTEHLLLEIYRGMPASRKLALVEDAVRTARELARAGLRLRHPDDPPGTLRRRLQRLLLGEDLATRVYGPLDSA